MTTPTAPVTRYYRFSDEAAFLAAMPPGFVRNQQTPDTGAPLHEGMQAICIMPHPLATGGQWAADPADPEGLAMIELVAPTVLPGFHVNVLGDAPPEWAAFEVYPPAPVCTFDGPALDVPAEGPQP